MRYLKKYLPLILLATALAAVYLSGWLEYATLENIQLIREEALLKYRQTPILVTVSFITLYTVITALSLPAATLLTLLGGAIFGSWLGTLWVIIGATSGAVIVFTIAKSTFGESLRNKVKKFQGTISSEIEESAFSYLLFLRLVPVFPFVIVNILPALFSIKLSTYIVTTALGIAPGTFVYVNLGSNLAHIKTLEDLLTIKTILAFTLLGLLVLLPILIKKIRTKR
ncbi:MAG: VTT domain-containing protein [Alphaproteobacteria bacterium]|nr:VTT domain-containing protein [Alphaproteobacteria bacterium]MDD9919224.1 VTT domain-containing protein [Alphaproteobacteria bacterium]